MAHERRPGVQVRCLAGLTVFMAAIAAALGMCTAGSAAASQGGVLGENLATVSAAMAPPAGAVGWGANEEGQLGDGTHTGPSSCSHEVSLACSMVPVPVGGLSEATAVAADTYHSLALIRSGAVMAWGDNDAGQLGDGNEVNSDAPVAVSGISEATAVAAGELYGLALLKVGTVMAWGTNYDGQLGDGSTSQSDVPVAVSGLSEVAAISAGGHHGLALLKNGTVMAWGENRYGQLGDGTTTKSDVPVAVSGLSEVSAIAAGAYDSLALLKNGTVVAWGVNSGGQLGDGTSAGPETCEAEGGGKLGCSRTPVAVSSLSEVAGIASGGCAACGPTGHSLALLKSGSVTAWGENGGGQLGDGTTSGPESCEDSRGKFACSRVPVAVSGLSEATAVTAGWYHSLALLKSGAVMSWGYNGFGQLGTGSTTGSDVPVTVAGMTEASDISAGGSFSLAIGVLVTLPAVTNVEPGDGPAAGGTAVTITGSHLTGATAVKFGSANAASFTVNSDASITATSPAGTGLADVTVTTATGTSIATPADHFDYRPAVSGVAPPGGPFGGGTSVTITGTNFTGATAVKFGSANAASFTVNSASSITAISPAGSGMVAIAVTTPGGTSPATPADQFGYGPNVTQVAPARGPGAGGTTVTITGTNFTGATAVKFGSREATSFTVNSETSITATSPAPIGEMLVVEVTVTTPEGMSPSSPAAEFDYLGGCEEGHAPTVTSVEPNHGPAGTSVTIRGERFFLVVCGDEGFSVRRVMFGSKQASFKSEGGGLVAIAPPGAGTVDVTVENLGASPATPADRFTYGAAEPPAVVSQPASAITQASATLNATVNPQGQAVSACQFEYGTSEAYGSTAPCTPAPGSASGPVAVSAAVTGLAVSTTYHVRIDASSVGGTSRGADETFQTLANAPIPAAVTEPASFVRQTSATLNAGVNPNGAAVSGCRFEYGPTQSYGSTAPCGYLPQSGETSVNVSASVGSLTPNSTYHVRIAASGPGGTGYGADRTFTTGAGGTPAYWYRNAVKLTAGVRVATISWGTIALKTKSPGSGEVTCKVAIAGTVWNPTGTGSGAGETQLLAGYDCEQLGICPEDASATLLAGSVPWPMALEPEAGAVRASTAHIKLHVACLMAGTEVGAGERLIGAYAPALINGTSALHPSFVEFGTGAGALEAEASAGTVQAAVEGEVRLLGYAHEEMLTAR